MSLPKYLIITPVMAALVTGCLEKQQSRPAGQVYVATEPAEATLLCNNITKGATPATIVNLEPGEHLITVKKSGYKEEKRTVLIQPDQRVALDIKMEPITGLLLIKSIPPGADVNINEAHRGKTPLFLKDLPPGKHMLTFSLKSYIPRTVETTIKDNTPQEVKVELVPDFAVLKCESEPTGADVFLNGNRKGKTPLELQKIPSGSHKIEFRLKGYSNYLRDIVVNAGQNQTVSASLQHLPCSFQVVTEPAGAKVFLGTQFKGVAPVSFEAMPGEHVIRAELAGYADAFSTNTLAGGQETTVNLAMEKNSGMLILTTEPAGVSVFINGENKGMSKIGESMLISEPFKIDMLSHGEHKLQLTKDGFFPIEKTISITPDQVLPLHEKLAQIPVPFTPDVAVTIRAGTGAQHTYKGMLKDKSNGNITLEIAPGVIREFQASKIINVEMISKEEKEESEDQSE